MWSVLEWISGDRLRVFGGVDAPYLFIKVSEVSGSLATSQGVVLAAVILILRRRFFLAGTRRLAVVALLLRLLRLAVEPLLVLQFLHHAVELPLLLPDGLQPLGLLLVSSGLEDGGARHSLGVGWRHCGYFPLPIIFASDRRCRTAAIVSECWVFLALGADDTRRAVGEVRRRSYYGIDTALHRGPFLKELGGRLTNRSGLKPSRSCLLVHQESTRCQFRRYLQLMRLLVLVVLVQLFDRKYWLRLILAAAWSRRCRVAHLLGGHGRHIRRRRMRPTDGASTCSSLRILH